MTPLLSESISAGTLAAECAVFIWQYAVLKETAREMFKDVRWKLIILAILISCIGCVWVKMLSRPSFFALVISAVLFFGIYALTLYLGKEQLVLEITGQLLDKLKRKHKNSCEGE